MKEVKNKAKSGFYFVSLIFLADKSYKSWRVHKTQAQNVHTIHISIWHVRLGRGLWVGRAKYGACLRLFIATLFGHTY